MLGVFDAGEDGVEPGRAAFSVEDLNAHRTYLLKVANRILNPRIRPRVSASDLVQQSILTAINQFRTFRGRSLPEMRAWLEGILRNEYRNCRRTHETCQRRGVSREVSMNVLVNEGLEWDCEDKRVRQEAALAEQWECIVQAVKRLSPCEAEAFQLIIVERLTVTEAAVRLGLTEAAMRKRYERSMTRLREILNWQPKIGMKEPGEK